MKDQTYKQQTDFPSWACGGTRQWGSGVPAYMGSFRLEMLPVRTKFSRCCLSPRHAASEFAGQEIERQNGGAVAPAGGVPMSFQRFRKEVRATSSVRYHHVLKKIRLELQTHWWDKESLQLSRLSQHCQRPTVPGCRTQVARTSCA